MTGVQTATWIDKSEWPDGPWQTEPDRVEWRNGELVLLAKRNPFNGTWCGYVGVPPGHVLHGVSDTDPQGYALDVHGGLTYAAACQEGDGPHERMICHIPQEGEPDEVWWLGFDCNHGFDLAPAWAERDRIGSGSYKDVQYVRDECERLAVQVKEAA